MSSNVISTREEADNVRSAIQNMGPYDESLYDKLTIAKEKGILDVLHRVLDDDAEQRARDDSKQSLIKRPIHIILGDAFRVLREILVDLAESRRLSHVVRTFTKDGRPAYIGILLFLGALLAYMFG
jgi:hypothetical protein